MSEKNCICTVRKILLLCPLVMRAGLPILNASPKLGLRILPRLADSARMPPTPGSLTRPSVILPFWPSNPLIDSAIFLASLLSPSLIPHIAHFFHHHRQPPHPPFHPHHHLHIRHHHRRTFESRISVYVKLSPRLSRTPNQGDPARQLRTCDRQIAISVLLFVNKTEHWVRRDFCVSLSCAPCEPRPPQRLDRWILEHTRYPPVPTDVKVDGATEEGEGAGAVEQRSDRPDGRSKVSFDRHAAAARGRG